MKNISLQGIFTALITPFNDDGSINFDDLQNLIKFQLDKNISGLVACGTTAETATMSEVEKLEIIKKCILLADKKVPVIAGAGSNSTSEACSMHKAVFECGANASLQVTPYYNKPTQQGLYKHFQAIAKSCDLPIVLYNVPSRTGINIDESTVVKLALEYPHIVAIKDANVDILRMQKMIHKIKSCRADFAILSGEDAFVLPLLAMGGDGVISVTSNLLPHKMVSMYKNFHNSQIGEAQAIANQLAEIVELMFFRSNPLPIKTALFLNKIITGNNFRLPLTNLVDEDLHYFEKTLAKLCPSNWI